MLLTTHTKFSGPSRQTKEESNKDAEKEQEDDDKTTNVVENKEDDDTIKPWDTNIDEVSTQKEAKKANNLKEAITLHGGEEGDDPEPMEDTDCHELQMNCTQKRTDETDSINLNWKK